MAVDVTVETVIARGVAEVASYAGDPGNAAEWCANITSVGWRTDPPRRVGSEMDFVARFLRQATGPHLSRRRSDRRHSSPR